MHKILRALILSDLFLLGSFGLVQPIFAVFMLNNIIGTSLVAIGVAAAIPLVTKAFLQIMIALWTDAESGNRRELFTLFIGSILMSLAPFGFVFATNLTHVYILQFVYGLGTALVYPGWIVIFSRYSRDEKRGYEWSVYSTVVSLGTATTAFLGGYMAELYSFRHIFVVVGVLSFIGTGFIVHVFRQEFTRQKHLLQKGQLRRR
ncbi:MAG: MFS transporter [bacterium]|nr:MFS transporter [bacterium]